MTFRAGQTHQSHRFEVWLNGQREPLAIAADDEIGYVERLVRDPAGEIRRDMLNREMTETLYGDVEIRPVNDGRFR